VVHQQKLLESLAQLDGLTEINNRRRFDQVFKAEWHRAMRNKTSLSVALLDIDFFKVFNDNFGHLAGDNALISVAHAVSTELNRSSDFAARYGGEEFVIICADTHPKDGLKIGERVRRAVEKLKIPTSNQAFHPWVTVSVGGASVVPRSTQQKEGLLKQADEMLYKAKEGGRNRVEWIELE